MKKTELAVRIAWTSALCACVATAHAQEAADDGRSAQLEEIVVTAQKREENLQAVPIAVTALGTDMLE
ncbi:MAG: hypothetical protein KA321_10475, partial [Pseudomonadales bacterium]|nr:hypothetical protein [Pseudomonadales bacterium]